MKNRMIRADKARRAWSVPLPVSVSVVTRHSFRQILHRSEDRWDLGWRLAEETDESD